MVTDIRTGNIVIATNSVDGMLEISATAIILAMGCRERPRGALEMAGTRCSGVMTAGTAQKYVNIDGYMPGKKVVILGSGDIGLIMARRMTLEGAEVKVVCEIMPYSGGLTRNIVQCLNDFNIPLRLSTTVVETHGKDRLEGVTIAQVDEHLKPIESTKEYIECDTLMLSVGLIPENELTRQSGIDMDKRTNGPAVYENMETSLSGVFACGNVVHVHDLVDFVTEESEKSGRSAAAYVLGHIPARSHSLAVTNGAYVTYTVPQKIDVENVEKAVDISFRVNRSFGNSEILVTSGDTVIARYKRRHMAPGEMEHILLTAKALQEADGPVTVLVKEA